MLSDAQMEDALVRYWSGAFPLGQGKTGALPCAGGQTDPAHDLAHIRRVVALAMQIGLQEGARLEILRPAAWFHDLVNLPKDHRQRREASRRSAEEARRVLAELSYPCMYYEDIAHAIEAHSFSAGIAPRTLEARVLQDADRLDSLGAIGIARTFSVSGQLGRPLFAPDDPFAEGRELDDGAYGLDHFFVKLFKLPAMMNTGHAKKLAAERAAFMREYLAQLHGEIVSEDKRLPKAAGAE